MTLVLKNPGSSDTLLLGNSSLDILIDACLDTKSARRACRLAKSVLKHHGVEAQFNGYWPIRVLHRKDVERIGEGGEVIINSNEIAVHENDLPKTPEVKDIFTINGRDYQLKSPLVRKQGLSVWVAI